MLNTDQKVLALVDRVSIAGSLSSMTRLQDVVGFLNETKTKQGKTVLRILETLHEIEALTKPICGLVWATPSLRRSDPAKFEVLREVVKRRAFLNKELARFRYLFRAEVTIGGGGDGESQWSVLLQG